MLPYRYSHFDRSLMQEDSGLRPTPGPGDRLPQFELTTTEHSRVRSQDFTGRKLFITFASVT
ncbi:MAG TPA: hypothetical protein VNR64_12080 [Vicinamibacterales bacterium]|nr:hypothetical protein [Vicinamibacterales bacterium]